jgi:hypothetical protein
MVSNLYSALNTHLEFQYCLNGQDAMTTLEDFQKATCYTLEFNRQSRCTDWNKVALACLYYKGLPDRLKDEISQIRKPTTLLELQDLVTTLDQHYWERQAEISCNKKLSTAQPQKLNDKSSDNCRDACCGSRCECNIDNQLVKSIILYQFNLCTKASI